MSINLLLSGRRDWLLPCYCRLYLLRPPAVCHTHPSYTLRPCPRVQQVHRSLAFLLPRLTTPQHGRPNWPSDDGPQSEGGNSTPDRCGSPCAGDRVVRYRGAVSVIEAGLPGICVRRCMLHIVYMEVRVMLF